MAPTVQQAVVRLAGLRAHRNLGRQKQGHSSQVGETGLIVDASAALPAPRRQFRNRAASAPNWALSVTPNFFIRIIAAHQPVQSPAKGIRPAARSSLREQFEFARQRGAVENVRRFRLILAEYSVAIAIGGDRCQLCSARIQVEFAENAIIFGVRAIVESWRGRNAAVQTLRQAH